MVAQPRSRGAKRAGAVRAPDPAGAYPAALFVASAAIPALLAALALAFGQSISPLTWYLARASGLTLYVLLWCSMMLGLGLTTAGFDRFASRGIVYSLHRFVTGMAYGFLSIHLLSLVIDTAVPFSLMDIVIPFRAKWGEPWTGLGVIAAYLLLIVGASSALLRRIHYRVWRATHWLTFPLYATALAHGWGAGTDTSLGWARAMYAATAAALMWLVLYRVLRGGRRSMVPPDAPRAPFDRMTARNAG